MATRWIPVATVYFGKMYRPLPSGEISRAVRRLGARGVRYQYYSVSGHPGFRRGWRLWLVLFAESKIPKRRPHLFPKDKEGAYPKGAKKKPTKKKARVKWLGFIEYKEKYFIPSVVKILKRHPNAELEIKLFRRSLTRVLPVSGLVYAVAVPPRYVSPAVAFRDDRPYMGKYGIPKIRCNWVNLSYIIRYRDGRYGYQNVWFWIYRKGKIVSKSWAAIYRDIGSYIKAGSEILTSAPASPRGRSIKSGEAQGGTVWFLFWEAYRRAITPKRSS